MSNTEFNSVLQGTGSKSASGLIAALEGRGIYVVKDGENPTALLPGTATYLVFNGVVFWYDSTDSLTAHDGVTCCVTSDGKRFKAPSYNGIQLKFYSVISRVIATPPVSPALGDSYIVAAGGTGAWAGKDKQITTYTARGWKFIVPKAYDMARVNAETLFYHYSAGGVWTAGFPALTLSANSIIPSMLAYGRFGQAVINQTTNTPPSSPSDGNAYIIAGSPTGAWVGHAFELAIWQTSAWAFYTPYEGAAVYDVNINARVKFDGTVWVSEVAGYSQVTSAFTAAVQNSANITDVNFNATAAPTTANSNHPDSVTLSHTAKAANKVLEIEYTCVFRANLITSFASSITPNAVQFAVQIDAVASMADWFLIPLSGASISGSVDTQGPWYQVNCKFRIVSADALAHVYTMRVFLDVSIGGGTFADIDIARRNFIIREVS